MLLRKAILLGFTLAALAVAITIGEWLRGQLLTGFPWNAFGYALTGPVALAQSAALIGVWGLTFLAVAIFTTPAWKGRSISCRVASRSPMTLFS